jgi:hypothetical protein
MCGRLSHLRLDNIFSPATQDMIDDIGEECDDDRETQRPTQRSFLTTQTGFQLFEWQLSKRICSQQWYHEVIRNWALGLFADYVKSILGDADIAPLPELDHIVNPPAVGSLANRKRTICHPAANESLWELHALAGWLFKDLRCGWVSFGTLQGGQMHDNLEFFREVLDLILVFCLFYYYNDSSSCMKGCVESSQCWD